MSAAGVRGVRHLPWKAVSGLPTMGLTTTRHPLTENNTTTFAAVVSHRASVFRLRRYRTVYTYNILIYIQDTIATEMMTTETAKTTTMMYRYNRKSLRIRYQNKLLRVSRVPMS